MISRLFIWLNTTTTTTRKNLKQTLTWRFPLHFPRKTDALWNVTSNIFNIYKHLGIEYKLKTFFRYPFKCSSFKFKFIFFKNISVIRVCVCLDASCYYLLSIYINNTPCIYIYVFLCIYKYIKKFFFNFSPFPPFIRMYIHETHVHTNGRSLIHFGYIFSGSSHAAGSTYVHTTEPATTWWVYIHITHIWSNLVSFHSLKQNTENNFFFGRYIYIDDENNTRPKKKNHVRIKINNNNKKRKE